MINFYSLLLRACSLCVRRNDDERLQKELKRIPPSDIQDWKNFVNEDLIVKDLDKLASMNYPKHQKSGGKPFGLSVLVNPELDEYSTCTSNDGWGFKVMHIVAPSKMYGKSYLCLLLDCSAFAIERSKCD